jgi:hypothetical protein
MGNRKPQLTGWHTVDEAWTVRCLAAPPATAVLGVRTWDDEAGRRVYRCFLAAPDDPGGGELSDRELSYPRGRPPADLDSAKALLDVAWANWQPAGDPAARAPAVDVASIVGSAREWFAAVVYVGDGAPEAHRHAGRVVDSDKRRVVMRNPRGFFGWTLAEPRAFVAYCGSQGELELMLEVASEAAVGLARERVAQGERWPRG